MPALQYTRDLADLLRAGRKTQTLRAKLPPGCVVGSTLTHLNGYRKGGNVVGRSTITAIDQVTSATLTEEDAVLDGFATLADLRARLDAMDAPPTLWRIRFTRAQVVARPACGPSSTGR